MFRLGSGMNAGRLISSQESDRLNFEKKDLEREIERLKRHLDGTDKELAKCRKILDEKEALLSKLDVEKR